METVRAKATDLETVSCITQTTIRTVYPQYYPKGAVDFFSEWHSKEKILEDIREGYVYLLIDDGPVATVTVKENHINRLFVLPDKQRKGYGKKLIEFAEDKIAESYDDIIIDSSLSAKKIYLGRGYKEIEYHIVKTDNGDRLCYDVMRKIIKE